MDAHAPMMLAAPTAVNAGNALSVVKTLLQDVLHSVNWAELVKVAALPLAEGNIGGVFAAILADSARIFVTKEAAQVAHDRLTVANDLLHTSPVA